MLTRLRVEGFKSLLDVDVRFGPFTCVAGPNGAGKSNLFDAIRFLSLLTTHPMMEAVRQLREARGRAPEAESLFTAFEGFRAKRMKFTAEMIVQREVEDDLGVESKASLSTVRYEVSFKLGEQDPHRLELIHESLVPIPISRSVKDLGFKTSREFKDSALTGVRRGGAFISTDERSRVIQVHQEGHGGRRVSAPKSSRTIVGGTASSDFPTILAAHREMASWKTLLLEPSSMRASSLYSDPKIIDARGGNLAAALHRLSRANGKQNRLLVQLANRLAELLEDVRELRIREDDKLETLTVELRGKDGVFHPARSLSDGTLRFLVLAVLSLDPEARGTICLEEPENGIHPTRIRAMVNLLRDIAVDPMHGVDEENPLRQVLVNTHSPRVFRQVDADDLLYASTIHVIRDKSRGRVTAIRVPMKSWRRRLQPQLLRMSGEDERAYRDQYELPFGPNQ